MQHGSGARRGVAAAWIGAAAVAASVFVISPAVAFETGQAPSTVFAPVDPTPQPQETVVPTTPDPTPTPTPSPTPQPTNTPEPDPSPAPTIPAETAAPTETPEPSEPATETPVPTQVPAVPPAAADPTTSVWSWVIAALVLAAAAVILVLGRRRAPVVTTGGLIVSTSAAPPDVPPSPADIAVTLAAMEDVGQAMTDAGYSVSTVRQTLEDIARANGVTDPEIIVFPTALLVSARGGAAVHTGAISSGEQQLLLHQVDDLQHIVDDARAGATEPAETRSRIRRMRKLPRPYTPLQRGASYVLLSAGLSVLLGASWTGIGLAALLGAGVGAALLTGERFSSRYRALLTVGIAFSVALAALLVLRLGFDAGVLPALIAPLVVLLPGALLTTGAIELATGQMVSGAGRLAAGGMQLVLLAVGIVAASALVGIPSLEVAGDASSLGVLAPWIAVGLFGVGIVVYQCAPPRSLGWILVVLYVAYGAQVIGALFFGGVLSALIGALAVTPVTVIVARQRSGPAALVSFMPAFWLLVPGALGLVGVASVLGGEASGTTSLITTVSTVVGISLGVLAGTALSSRLGRPVL